MKNNPTMGEILAYMAHHSTREFQLRMDHGPASGLVTVRFDVGERPTMASLHRRRIQKLRELIDELEVINHSIDRSDGALGRRIQDLVSRSDLPHLAVALDEALR